MEHTDTVFALSTPVGDAIAVMRISGPEAQSIASSIFSGRLEDRRVSFGRIVDENGETVDSCLCTLFKGPRSYTGEDMVEISVHGSYAVAAKLIELLGKSGRARQAEPGEFTKRAYLNGKMDLARAEAVMDIIASSAERSRKAAVSQLEGRLSAVINDLYERLKASAALLAAYLDDDTDDILFCEEDFTRELDSVKRETDELERGGMRSRILREGARIAIIGSPNVGKSSLLNALIMRDRAIVTAIPGTTRDTVEEAASLEGIPVVFVDTAGIRETDDEVERMGIERSKRESLEAQLVLWLVEGARPLSGEDEAARNSFLEAGGKKILAVITKSDLEQVTFPDENGLLSGVPSVTVSTLTGEGLTQLRSSIVKLLAPEERETLVTNARHIEALNKTSKHISEAILLTEAGALDAAFFEIRAAMESLASILGRVDAGEELIDSVFADFCVGK